MNELAKLEGEVNDIFAKAESIERYLVGARYEVSLDTSI